MIGHGKKIDTGHFQKCHKCKKFGEISCENDCDCKCYEPIREKVKK